MLRSCLSVVFAIFQPSPRAPTTFACGTRTSVKKTWLKEFSPIVAGHRLERLHLDARASHGNEHVADARVLRRLGLGADEREHHLGLVRGAGPDLLPVDQEVVAVFRRAFVCRLARSLPEPGSE